MKSWKSGVGICFLVVIILLSFISHQSSTYAASIGDKLLTPEDGWTRYDDSFSKIKRSNGTFGYTPSEDPANAYKGGYYYSTNKGATISFAFVGTKVRLIAPIYKVQSNDIQVSIDGQVVKNYSAYSANVTMLALVFEEMNLQEGVHIVSVVNNQDGKELEIDAIDIDDTGEMVDIDQPTPTPVPTPTVTPEPTTEPTPTVTPTPTPTPTITPSPSQTATPTPTPEQPTGDRAILVVTMNTGLEKEFDLSMEEVNSFITWYENKQAGTGKASYAIDKHDNNKGPFTSRKEYVIFDKILTFSVDEYSAK
ncbi:fibronectin type III domain-containing protein [Paenibacillus graminis]|uniref:fibronectin type III domain-containing protein n=1 Tax=Paenibacillus graminis TaxID=189425 RepID=UPI002DB5E7F0|nr:fibronectin type III domain-containing protein [Paenibacillus graminis]MEC0168637.1 fibronectin type III domain-containing protein [Paenibacillus graminis]